MDKEKNETLFQWKQLKPPQGSTAHLLFSLVQP